MTGKSLCAAPVAFVAVAIITLAPGTIPASVPPTSYHITSFHVPGSVGTSGAAIDNGGDVVGQYTVLVHDSTVDFAYERLADGRLLKINDPNSYRGTGDAGGINNTGTITGNYYIGAGIYSGFLYKGGVFTDYQVAGNSTGIAGVNDNGDFVGSYFLNPSYYGFVNSGGQLTVINCPDALEPEPAAINNAGFITGSCKNRSGIWRGFVMNSKGAIVAELSYPGASWTIPSGINNRNVVVGYATADRDYGFVFQNNKFTRFNIAGSRLTAALGINDLGQITGTYEDQLGHSNAFIATPNN
jgi:hypothetical protein